MLAVSDQKLFSKDLYVLKVIIILAGTCWGHELRSPVAPAIFILLAPIFDHAHVNEPVLSRQINLVN